MKNHEIFKTNPNLKEVHMTSDGQAFYNDNDAKMHAKTLEKKEVELVLNSKFLVDIEVDEEEELETVDEPKLEDLTKSELVDFAKVNLELELSAKDNKPVLLAAIDTKLKELSKVLDANLKVVDAPNLDQSKDSTGTGAADTNQTDKK